MVELGAIVGVMFLVYRDGKGVGGPVLSKLQAELRAGEVVHGGDK